MQSEISLSQLFVRPKQIHETKNILYDEIVEALYTNYDSLTLEFKNVTTNDVLKSLSQLKTSLNDFKDASMEEKQSKALVHNTLAKYDEISCLINIPNLSDVCIKNQLFHEVLDLDLFARKLNEETTGDSIVHEIQAENEQIVHNMIIKLIQLLSQDLTLQMALKITGLLRRFSILDENELSVLFLQQRLIFFKNIEFKNRNIAFLYLKELLETFKIHVFQIILQYQTCFENPFHLSSFMNHLQLPLVHEFKKYIKDVNDGDELNRLSENIKICGDTLRMGYDVRGVLNEILLKRTLELFKFYCMNSVTHFKSKLNQWKVKFGNAFLILSELTNDLLIGLNELRKFAPLALKSECTQELLATFSTLVDLVLSFTFNDKILYAQFLTNLQDSSIQHVTDCFQSIYTVKVDIISLIKKLKF